MRWKMIGNSVNSLKHWLELKGKFLYFHHGGYSYDFIQIAFDSLPAVHCKDFGKCLGKQIHQCK